MAVCVVVARVRDRRGRKFAMKIGQLLPPHDLLMLGQLANDGDRLRPILLLLKNFQQVLRGDIRETSVLELDENGLGAIEQPCLKVILAELRKGLDAMLFAEVFTSNEILVHADCPVGLTATTEQAAKGEMKLDRLRVDPDRFDKRVDRPVLLLIEQEVEAGEVGARKRAGFLHHLADIQACGKPAEDEEKRERKKPPQFEFHRVQSDSGDWASATGGEPAGGVDSSVLTRLRSREISRRSLKSEIMVIVAPSTAPTAKKIRMTKTRGNSHSPPMKNRRSTS